MKIIKRAVKTQPQSANTTQECNYANNYYGDQVCTITTNKK